MPDFLADLGSIPSFCQGTKPRCSPFVVASQAAAVLLYPDIELQLQRRRFLASNLNRLVRSVIETAPPAVPEEISSLAGTERAELEAKLGCPIENIPELLKSELMDENLAWLSLLFGGANNVLALLGDALSPDGYDQLLAETDIKVHSVGWAVYLYLIMSGHHSDSFRRGATLEKGKVLAAEWLDISYRSMKDYWVELRPAAHLCAAIVALRVSGVSVGIFDFEHIPVVLGLARTFQRFLSERPSAPLQPGDLWLIPDEMFRDLPVLELPGGGFDLPVPPLDPAAIEFVRGERSAIRKDSKKKRAARAHRQS